MTWWRSPWFPVAFAALVVAAVLWTVGMPSGFLVFGLVALTAGAVGLAVLPRRSRAVGEETTAWWRSPWCPVVLAVPPVVVSLWAASVPGGYFGSALAAIGLWAVVCLIAVVVGLLAFLALPRPRRRHLRPLWPLLLVPTVLAGTFALTGTGAVAAAVFDTHRSGLERLAGEVREHGGLTDRRVGLLPISSAAMAEGCAVLTVADAGLLDSTGYAYCPGAAPVSAPGEGYRFTPIEGSWYEFRFSW
jgi:hypothetical protein